MRAILVFINCEGKSDKTVSQTTTFLKGRESRSPSANRPNALPLGQTDPHVENGNMVLNVHRNHVRVDKGFVDVKHRVAVDGFYIAQTRCSLVAFDSK